MNTSYRVDHMVCGVGGGVLLYSDLGYLVDYRGSISNSGHSGGSKYMGSIGNNRSSLHLNSIYQEVTASDHILN